MDAHKSPRVSLVSVIVAYVVFAVLLYGIRFTLVAIESRSVIIYDTPMLWDSLLSVGGVATVVAQLLTQWFTLPIVALAITAALLTCATVLTATVQLRLGTAVWAIPLSFATGLSLWLVQIHPMYALTGTVALILMLLAVWLAIALPITTIGSLCMSILTIAVYLGCGSVGVLMSVMMLSYALIYHRKKSLYVLSAIAAMLVVAALAWYGIKIGAYVDFNQAFTPAQYYDGWSSVAASSLLPWLTLVAIMIISVCSRYVVIKKESMYHMTLILSAIAVSVFGFVGYRTLSVHSDENFARLSALVASEQWQEVIDLSYEMDMNDTRNQNCLNLALAHTGQLPKTMFQHPCRGRESLMEVNAPTPQMYMLLSDVFYGIGHLSLAQKYAFEANEGVNNYSPRMLQRLADINIIKGEYRVAKKYLDLLAHTLKYRDWAQGRYALLNDDAVAAHPQLGAKLRSAMVPDNFAGILGIEHDLKQILRSAPDNKMALDYLGCLCLSQRDVPAFMDVISEFYGTEALGLTLPKHFQEAVAVASLATDERLDIRYHLHPSVMENCRNYWSRRAQAPNTFWEYLRHKP